MDLPGKTTWITQTKIFLPKILPKNTYPSLLKELILCPPKNFPIVTRSLPEKTIFQTKRILHLSEKLNSYTRVEKLKRLISVVF